MTQIESQVCTANAAQKYRTHLSLLLVVCIVLGCQENEVDYNTQIKPILNKHCISCHGGVKKKHNFSLMTRALALSDTDSEAPAIIPGDARHSPFIERLHSSDPEERMPLDAPPLSEEDIQLLTRWIDQGAQWGLHWAYQPLEPPSTSSPEPDALGLIALPTHTTPALAFIDQEIRSQLHSIGLDMNPRAEKGALLRRLSMDIIGLPPPTYLQEQYLRDDNPWTYAQLVDTLLAMPQYGEKWSSMWLDIARYADSKGFEKDQNRSIWTYRDYVIKSFNEDKPYDDFIIEQLAGDLLEDPSDEQMIATGFHRNTPTNDEGGSDNEEYRVRAIVDRVGTTWEGLMGTTMACVQCHGHPYDPFPHKDFYRSFAFLNNTRDADTGEDYPRFKLFDSLQINELNAIKQWIHKVSSAQRAKEIASFLKTTQPVIYSIETDALINADHYDTKYLGLRKDGSARIKGMDLTGKNRILTRLLTPRSGGVLNIYADSLNGLRIARVQLKNSNWTFWIEEIPIKEISGVRDIYLQYQNNTFNNKNYQGALFDWFYPTESFPGREHPEHNKYKNLFYKLLESEPDHTLVMIENPPDRHRMTHVFHRGNWLSKTEEVQPGVPSVLPPLSPSEEKPRLAFARWIVSKSNPLTARTLVNRIWEQLFGQGIVITTEDLGSQGALPTHPQVLDLLSYRWMHQYHWSIKQLIKTIVLTETYQQSAKNTRLKKERDPYNQYLSRGPRIRLSAEQIRDQALAISGLLSEKMYGPPVMPFQPPGLWQTPYNSQDWQESEGEDQYRRAVYTMVKRSSIYPQLETFDMSQRQVCVARRIRTNTPLQALITLNDPVFVEASRCLAQRMTQEGGDILADQINYAYKLGMGHPIDERKNQLLQNLYHKVYQEYASTSSDTIITPGAMALQTVANAILNLDELLNK